MAFHVTSDGTPKGTRVTDDAGKEISGAFRVFIDINAHEPEATKLVLWTHAFTVDATGRERVVVCPKCGADLPERPPALPVTPLGSEYTKHAIPE